MRAAAGDIVSAGGAAEAAEVDALDERAVDTHLQSVVDRAGRVAISFNAVGIPNAGILGVPLAEMDVEAFSRGIRMVGLPGRLEHLPGAPGRGPISFPLDRYHGYLFPGTMISRGGDFFRLLLASGLGLPLAALPPGFAEKEVAKGLHSPSALAIAPDGRVFVGEQEGAVRLLVGDSLLPEPALTLEADAFGQRGLQGLALDPDFPTSPYLYVFYTARRPASHNRVSRFRVSGNRADSAEEEILLELPDVGSAVWHMGGGLAFGADGKLYCGTGDLQKPALSQDPASPMGKILRIDRDGTIPPDGPLAATAAGPARAIWAQGLRNPFTLAAKPGGAGILANDVGENAHEEIDSVTRGGNYGWPVREGRASDPKFLDPLHAYSHNDGCAIMGGDYYAPARPRFPAEYVGRYFFADFCRGWIRAFDPEDGKASVFLDKSAYPTGLRVAPDGSLYYLSRGYATGPNQGEIKRGLSKVFKIVYAGPGGADPGPRHAGDAGDGPRIVIAGPTPSAPAYRIRISIPDPGSGSDTEPGRVRVEIQDVQGRVAAVLADRPRFRGQLDLAWAPGGSPVGVRTVVLKRDGRAWARVLPLSGM